MTVSNWIRTRGRGAGILGVGVFLVSCMATGRRIPPTPREGMWVHFVESAHLQLAVARGDLDRAREYALAMVAREPVRGVPPEASVELEVLRSRIEEVAAATDVSATALAAARVAASCGDCHDRFDAGPVFMDVAPAPDPDDVDHMVEHLWAADRMWEALIIPSDSHWNAGARVLADHAVPLDLLPPGTSTLGVRMKALGLEALQDATVEARVMRYAQILETCANCHVRARRTDPR